MKNKTTLLIERPAPWLNNPNDGHKHRIFFSNLLLSASELDLKVEIDDIPFGSDFAPRIAAKNQVLLSYHSVGASPGVWRLKESYIFPYYYFDETGYSGWAKIVHDDSILNEVEKINENDANKFVEELKLNLIQSNSSKYEQGNEEFKADGKYIFYPLQTADDHVVALSRFNQRDIIKFLSVEAIKYGYKLVIKRHPWCKNKEIEKTLEDALRNGAIVSNASIHKIIPNASAVITANSGVGFEALIHGVPVFTTGKCDYEMVTEKIYNIPQITKCFTETNPNKLTNKFIYFYFKKYCIDCTNTSSIKEKIVIAVKKRSELAQSIDSGVEFIHSESIKYFSKVESDRRQLISTKDQLNDLKILKKSADEKVKELIDAQAEFSIFKKSTSQLVFDLYEKLTDKISNINQIEIRNKSNTLKNNKNFNAEYYQNIHDNDVKFQQNNWLLPYLNILTNTGANSIREIGCGNGSFIKEAAKSVPIAIGLDWAHSPKLANNSSIQFVQEDITVADLDHVDLNCSADVLEHIPYSKLLSTIEKLNQSALANFHVIACYDDGHSHLSIFEPSEWLYMFKKFDPNYRIVDIKLRNNDINKVICVITNMQSA